jgi:hypothetical protein
MESKPLTKPRSYPLCCATEGHVRHTALLLPRRTLLLIASLLMAGMAGTAAQAAPISVDYSTSMSITDIGVGGPPVVGYVGVTDAKVHTDVAATYGTVLNPLPSGMGSLLPLGEITIGRLPGNPGQTTTYDHTPFYLTVTVNSLNGETHTANPQSYTVAGYLTGALTNDGPSSLTATFLRPDFQSASIPVGTIASLGSGGFDTFLSLPDGTTTISRPDGIPAGLTLGGVLISVQSAPEPGSFAILALLGLAQAGWIGLRNRPRRGQAA